MAAAVLTLLAIRVLANPTPGAADPSYDGQETAFLGLINQYREANGAGDLSPQENLDAAADWYATDMATKNYYGGPTPDGNYCAQFGQEAHCDSLGRDPGHRLGAFGYASNYAGENIAAGFGDAQSVFNAWQNSEGHNRNMLDPNYHAIGIGWACNSAAQYDCYWVTDFGANAGPNGPTPTPVGSQPTETPPPTPVPTAPPTGQPTSEPTAAPTPMPSPVATPTPTTLGPRIWGDINCDGVITAEDAIELLRGGAGIYDRRVGCPSAGNTVSVNGWLLSWGDTDCLAGVQVIDGIDLLEYVAGLPLTLADSSCPPPGTLF